MRHTGVALTDEEIKKADAVVIVTDHSSIDYQRLVNRAALVIDTRNAMAKTTAGRARVVSLSSTQAAEPDSPKKGKEVA